MVRNFLFIGLIFCGLNIQAQKSLNQLKAEKAEIQKKIELTNDLIQKNEKNRKYSIRQLSTISSKLKLQENLQSNLVNEVSVIENEIKKLNYGIDEIELEIERIKSNYSKLVVANWERSRAGNDMLYILAGKDYTTMYRRFRYLSEMSRFRKKQVKQAELLQDSLELRKEKVQGFMSQKLVAINSISSEKDKLAKDKKKNEAYIRSLKSKQSVLQKELSAHKKKSSDLQKYIDKVLAETIKKKTKSSTGKFELTPEQKLVSSNFVANKGKLPWPVGRGVIIRKFGPYVPKGLSKVKANSNGIDIETDSGSEARCVFSGEVSGVYKLPGYHYGVIVQHGTYFTFYAGLNEVFVKAGESVDTKEPLGKIYNDPKNGTVLHFEVYQKTTRMNPSHWISK